MRAKAINYFNTLKGKATCQCPSMGQEYARALMVSLACEESIWSSRLFCCSLFSNAVSSFLTWLLYPEPAV